MFGNYCSRYMDSCDIVIFVGGEKHSANPMARLIITSTAISTENYNQSNYLAISFRNSLQWLLNHTSRRVCGQYTIPTVLQQFDCRLSGTKPSNIQNDREMFAGIRQTISGKMLILNRCSDRGRVLVSRITVSRRHDSHACKNCYVQINPTGRFVSGNQNIWNFSLCSPLI